MTRFEIPIALNKAQYCILPGYLFAIALQKQMIIIDIKSNKRQTLEFESNIQCIFSLERIFVIVLENEIVIKSNRCKSIIIPKEKDGVISNYYIYDNVLCFLLYDKKFMKHLKIDLSKSEIFSNTFSREIGVPFLGNRNEIRYLRLFSNGYQVNKNLLNGKLIV